MHIAFLPEPLPRLIFLFRAARTGFRDYSGTYPAVPLF